MKKEITVLNMADYDGAREAYADYCGINECEPTDAGFWDYFTMYNEDAVDCEKLNLGNIKGKILLVADIGLWYGRRQGYKTLTDINELIDFVAANEFGKITVVNNQCCITLPDHDGTTYATAYIIRDDKEDVIYNLTDDIYNGKDVSKKLYHYCKSLGVAIGKIYGWQKMERAC